MIEEQVAVIAKAQQMLDDNTLALEQAIEGVTVSKNLLNSSIKANNRLSREMESTISDFLDLEAEVLDMKKTLEEMNEGEE